MTILFTGKSIGFMNSKNAWITATSDHPRFAEIVKLVQAGETDVAADLIDLRSFVTKALVNSNMKIVGDEILYGGRIIPGILGRRIIEMHNLGFDIKHLELFVSNLFKNPSMRAVEELYAFLEVSQLPITDDGHFLAYKSVQKDFTDHHTGKMDNSPGATVSMERNQVDEDKDKTCSYGLHFAAHEYAEGFQRGGTMVVLKINPRDVVSIPSDYGRQKGRTCAYTVLYEVARDDKGLVGATIVGKAKKDDCLFVGDTVCLSDEGKRMHGDSPTNPHAGVGILTSVQEGQPFCYNVLWFAVPGASDEKANSYKLGELEYAPEDSVECDDTPTLLKIGTTVVLSEDAKLDTYTDLPSNPHNLTGVIRYNTRTGPHVYSVAWSNGRINSYTVDDLVAGSSFDTSAWNTVEDDDECISYIFVGKAEEFPKNDKIAYTLSRLVGTEEQRAKQYTNFNFHSYVPGSGLLRFRKDLGWGGFSSHDWVTIKNLEEWSIETDDTEVDYYF